ncbi:MAG: RICIN domain-containing protein, partial [Cystobacter sp.]
MSLYRSVSLLGALGMLAGCATQETEGSDATGEFQGAAVVSSVTEGDYVIRSVMTGKCIDIDAGSTADGAKVQ